jgi:hypothetical protein
MTDTPIADQAHAAARLTPLAGDRAAPPVQQATTRWGRIHHDLTGIGHALLHMAPVLESIASSPLIDELVEAALAADGLGVEASAFQAAIDALNGASQRKAQAAMPAPAAAPVEALPALMPVTTVRVADRDTATFTDHAGTVPGVLTPNGTA